MLNLFNFLNFQNLPVSVYLVKSFGRISSDTAENGIIRKIVVKFINVARIVARIVETFVDILVIFGHEIDVVEEKTVEAVLKGIKKGLKISLYLFWQFRIRY